MPCALTCPERARASLMYVVALREFCLGHESSEIATPPFLKINVNEGEIDGPR